MLAPCAFPAPQGTPVYVRALASRLVALGHSVDLVTYASPVAADPADGFCWHRRRGRPPQARSGPHWRRPLADLDLLRVARRVARAAPPALIWAHQPEGLALALLLRPALGVPVVLHSHGMMAEELPTYARRRQRLWRALGVAIDRALPRWADATLAFDPAHAGALTRAGVPRGRVWVLPPRCVPLPLPLAGTASTPVPGSAPRREHGATRRPLTSSPAGGAHAHWPRAARTAMRADAGSAAGARPAARPRLVYSGNFDGYQNLPLLLAAWPAIRLLLPQATLLLATHHAVGALMLPAGMAAVRVRDMAHMAVLLGAADVGVCPRRLHAGVPIKLLNYQAAGLPVVTCCPQARAWWGSTGNLWVVPPSPAGFAAGVVAAWRAAAAVQSCTGRPPANIVSRRSGAMRG